MNPWFLRLDTNSGCEEEKLTFVAKVINHDYLS